MKMTPEIQDFLRLCAKQPEVAFADYRTQAAAAFILQALAAPKPSETEGWLTEKAVVGWHAYYVRTERWVGENEELITLCRMALSAIRAPKPERESVKLREALPRFKYWAHNYGPSGKRDNGFSQHTIAYGANVFNIEGPDDAVRT